MRTLFIACLAGLSVCGCATGAERFSVSAKLVHQPERTGAPLRLAIELRNDSGQTQRVNALTNLFEGKVHLRTTNGQIHEFIQTDYWNLRVGATRITPTVELAPGGSCRWEHSLAEFIDWHPRRTELGGYIDPISDPILSAEFQPGCEIWCAFDVLQKKILDERRSKIETTATVVSPPIRHSK